MNMRCLWHMLLSLRSADLSRQIGSVIAKIMKLLQRELMIVRNSVVVCTGWNITKDIKMLLMVGIICLDTIQIKLNRMKSYSIY